MSYIELHTGSAFSFLRGASFPEQLAETAAELEMPVLALLDRNGVYGAPRFSVTARENNLRPIIGCELLMEDGAILPVLVENRTGYKNLCELLTQAHLRSEKGKCAVQWSELPQFTEGLVALFGLGSAGCQPAPSGSLPDGKCVRQATAHHRPAACAPRNSEDRAQLLVTGLSASVPEFDAFVLNAHFFSREYRLLISIFPGA